MIKRIITVPRKQVEYWYENNISPFVHWSLISIYGDSELMTFSIINKIKKLNCRKVLSLKFDDITKQIADNFHLFNEQDANFIVNFLNKINSEDIETLVIHCAAGISRSGAVGVFACRYLKLDERKFMEENKHIAPNFHVLSTLNKVSGFYDNYIDCWKDIDNNVSLENIF